MEGVDDLVGRLVAIVPLGFCELEKNVDVLERLGLSVALIGAGQEAAINREFGHEEIAHLVLARGRIVLLALVELEAALELAERLLDGEHQFFLQ